MNGIYKALSAVSYRVKTKRLILKVYVERR